MKKTLLLSAIIGVSLTANAQSTLTSSINPHPGDNHIYYTCNYQAPGAAGANGSWDFSSATTTGNANIQYTDCSGNSSCSQFPGTNLVINQSGSGAQSANMFWTADNGKQSINGVIGGGVSIPYSDPEEMLHFPFTYGTTFTDHFAATFTNGVTFYRSGTITVTGDAYGTLKTPSGTFVNTIRVHRVENYHDSANYGGAPLIMQYVSDIYTWYSPLVREILASTSSLTTMGGTPVQSFMYSDIVPTGVAGISNLEASLDLYPNPVQGQLNVKFRLNMAQDLRISVTDILGKEVATIAEGKFQSGDQQFTFNTSSLAAGMYVVRVQSGENTVVRKIQVQ